MHKFKSNSSSYETPINNVTSSPKDGSQRESAQSKRMSNVDKTEAEEAENANCDVTSGEEEQCFARVMTSSSLDSVRADNNINSLKKTN